MPLSFQGDIVINQGAGIVRPNNADLLQGQSLAAVTALAVGGVATSWTAYTPTVTAGSGTFTTASATGRFLTIGKLTFVQITVTITTNGTAASTVRATLPNTPGNVTYYLSGRESTVTGKGVVGQINPSSTFVGMIFYDGLYPGGTGYTLNVSGVYENT